MSDSLSYEGGQEGGVAPCGCSSLPFFVFTTEGPHSRSSYFKQRVNPNVADSLSYEDKKEAAAARRAAVDAAKKEATEAKLRGGGVASASGGGGFTEEDLLAPRYVCNPIHRWPVL